MPESNTPTTTDTPKTLDELISEARASLIANHEASKKEHLTESRAKADAAWAESERQRKLAWCKEWWRDNFFMIPDPYENFHDEDFVRVYLPYEDRPEALCRAGLLGPGLRVWLYRRGGKATVAEVQAWLEPVVPWPVYGDKAIALNRLRTEDRIIIHAEGVSAEMLELLTCTWAVTTEWGVVSTSFTRDEKEHPELW